jgi:TatD DNase family protein
MKIDIHRHASDYSTEGIIVRNLFHYQVDQIKSDCLYSAGLHPWHVKAETLYSDLGYIQRISTNQQVIAIGETGIDKAIDIPVNIQIDAFRKQITIAAQVQKPVIIHCVRAYQEILEERGSSGHKCPWIIHWFNTSKETGLQLIKKDIYLSFGHSLFNERSKAYKTFPYIPLNRIFLETDDAGYNIDEIYSKAADLRKISSDEMELQIENNFYQCFRLKL